MGFAESKSQFRAAFQLQFDFHRAVYNLGTVLYGLAEDTSRSGQKMNTKELPAADLYSLSAVYIAAAHALKPEYPVKVSFPFLPGFTMHKSPRDSSYDS
jgi:hypothetical protein